jgi:hypothetical protein
MAGFLYTVPLVLALTAVVLGVMRSIMTAWLNHRLRLELLRKLEKNPDLVASPGEAQDLYENMTSGAGNSEVQDYTFTGIALGIIGGACLVIGLKWRIGQLAAGVYWGGMICVFLGALLALIGLMVRLLGRSASKIQEAKPKKELL